MGYCALLGSVVVCYGGYGLVVICAVCFVILVFDLTRCGVGCLGAVLVLVCLYIRWAWVMLFLLSFFGLDLLVVMDLLFVCLVDGWGVWHRCVGYASVYVLLILVVLLIWFCC